jgi:hypothetical protein
MSFNNDPFPNAIQPTRIAPTNQHILDPAVFLAPGRQQPQGLLAANNGVGMNIMFNPFELQFAPIIN